MPNVISKYNILILINVRWWNATAFYAVNIARLLHKKGHKVIIGCNKSYPAYEKAKMYGLNVSAFNFYGFNLIKLFYNFIKMLILIKKENIKIINAHRSEDYTFALLAKLFTGIKFILTRGDQRKIKNNFLSRIRYIFCDAIILTCYSLFQQNRSVFYKLKDKIKIIYGSIDEENFKITKSKNTTRNKYKIDSKNVIIGIAGRLDYVKDQYTFIKAAELISKEIKNVYFIVAGKEEHIKVQELKKICQRLNLTKKILILKIVDDICDVINLFDIGIITSVNSETISRVLLEYLYLKKPVIGTNVNAIGEIIKNGYNGEIIKPGDFQDLGLRASRLIQNKKMMKRYSENSYLLYQNKYSEEVFYNQYLDVIQAVMK